MMQHLIDRTWQGAGERKYPEGIPENVQERLAMNFS